MRTRHAPLTCAVLLLCAALAPAVAPLRAADGDADAETLAARALAPFLDVFVRAANGKAGPFTLTATVQPAAGGAPYAVAFGGQDEQHFYLSISGPENIEGTLLRTPERIVIELPAKKVRFLAEGAPSAGTQVLRPREALDALIRLEPTLEQLWSLVEEGDGFALSLAAQPWLKTRALPEAERPAAWHAFAAERGWTYLAVQPGKRGPDVRMALRDGRVRTFRLDARQPQKDGPPLPLGTLDASFSERCELPVLAPQDGLTVRRVARDEMERTLRRGLLRAVDLKYDELHAKEPAEEVRSVPGARLQVEDGQRTVWLSGTARERGVQHGKLLARDVRRVADSTLYVAGLFHSASKGTWFLDDIRGAWARLEPHIDPALIEELQGLSEGSGVPYDELKLANVFPELFHCSGFALSGEATAGGVLYHGRVLDYMTEMGFQHVQADFVQRPAGKKAFVNIGYAGFVGSVSGMNDAQLSVGEMGGRGEGAWDGTPMAFLLRRVLENAGSLAEARAILTDAKRTCEYFYVLADGKNRSSVAVGAWPEKIEFIEPGAAHERLPVALAGCVLLSAGERYEALTGRVKENFGKLDEQGALKLMERPVAMRGNLHNVLFVPERQVYWVAHASRKGNRPAAEQEYVKHDLAAQLKVLEEVARAQKP